MRKTHLFLLIFGLITLIFTFGEGTTYAACGSGWFNSNCGSSSPYCVGSSCTVDTGVKAVEDATGGQITKKPISEYAQGIIKYLMGFISLIAVIYIVYAGFQLMIGAGDEEKMKKTRQIITYVFLGIVIMWLAYPIIKTTTDILKKTTYELGLVPHAMAAYTESDKDTFADYRNKIKEAIGQMESEYTLSKTVSISTIQNVKNLVQGAFDRLPDSGNAESNNREAKQSVDTYLSLAIQDPTNSNHVSNAINRVASFLDRVTIERISGDINAGPPEGNAPLSVSFRADQIKDPSGTTPGDNNYIWWTRENGGYRRELGRGPSLGFTFTKEGTYTVFLDVVSGSRNKKGKIDVLPLSVSKQITVKPKLGEIILLINGVNVSNMDKLKISPSIGKMGIILDASASRAIGNGTIAETKWDFGNGESSINRGGPIVERQIYANQAAYILKLSMKTNDGQLFTKEIQLLLLDPVATIKLDKNTGHIGEEFSMSTTSYFSDTKNVEYSWKIQDESGNKIVKSGEGINFKYKFETVGSYIVTLTSKSPNGGIDTDSKIVTIESREPVVAIDNPHPIKSERPNTILFDASKSYDPDSNSRKNLTYTWKIDGQTINLDNIENNGAKGTFTFNSKGSHKVSLVVANVYGKVSTMEVPFDVISTLSVNIVMTPKVVKQGDTVTFIGQSSDAEFFEWNMGDGSAAISGSDRIVTHEYKQSGTYDVRLSVNRDGGSETNTITRKIYVTETESPFAIINATNTSNSVIEEDGACNGNKALVLNRADSTTFNASNSVNLDGTTSGLNYTWKYFGKARTTQSITEKFNELGCFPIELTVRSSKNGSTHTTTQYIKLTNQSPEITSLSISQDSAKKDSQKILVKVKANGAIDPDGVVTSYIWYFTTESDPEPQNVQITQKDEITFVLPNITEKYYFGVILEDNDGAKMNSAESGKSPTPLIIDNSNGNINLPLITLTTPKTVINVGEKTQFSVQVKTIIPGVNITNKSEYAWDFDGDGRIDEKSITPMVEHIYTKSGDFNMKVRVTNNGVSNSKYQTIHVKNKLKANVYGYKLPDGRIYFINASEGSYDSAHWEIGSTISESLSSVMIDTSNTATTGKLSISSNNAETDSIDIDFSKIETITGDGLRYQSYPKSNNDTITLKNPNDTIILSMFGNSNTSNYSIDTNALIDTSLDGTPDNDSDNKNDVSYTEGGTYSIYNIGSDNKREHKLKLALIKDGAVTSTRTITVILDYISATSENDIGLTGTGTEGLSTGDRAKLEELSKMIRELTDSDRIILMQRYNTLVENWNNPFDKAKSLIDIQEGIESGTMDTVLKGKMSKIVDELLIGDSEVTDEIGIAALLIKDLIPKESPNHDSLLAKLAEIESHPTLLDINKKLGKEMLVLIENDSTIPDKYKGHIKNQLLVIINGGAKSIPAESTETVTTSSSSGGILGFIAGFVKIFFIIIGIILIIGIAAFGFYRITRKGDSIGFQDFLIDAVFHNDKNHTTGNTETKITPTVEIVTPPIATKEDPLSSYAPVVVTPTKDTLITPIVNPVNTETVAATSENIPDWLKAPTQTPIAQPITTKEASEITVQDAIHEEVIPETLVENNSTKESIVPNKIEPVIASTEEANVIPDWIKNTTLTKEVTSTETIESSSLKTIDTESSIMAPSEEKLPDWLMSSIQREENSSVEDGEVVTTPEDTPIDKSADLTVSEEIIPIATPKKIVKKPKPATPKKENQGVSATPDNIPDWLK